MSAESSRRAAKLREWAAGLSADERARFVDGARVALPRLQARARRAQASAAKVVDLANGTAMDLQRRLDAIRKVDAAARKRQD